MFLELLELHINSTLSLLILFLNSFLSATILPMGSEILFITLLKLSEHSPFLLWLIASFANTLGGITNLFVGRYLSLKLHNKSAKTQKKNHKQENRTKRIARIYGHKLVKSYGYYALLLSWMPIIGDIICILAGWKRLSLYKSSLMIALGKMARYYFLLMLFYS